MNKTEIVMIIAQWNFAVVYPTARVANTNTISDNNWTFVINYEYILVTVYYVLAWVGGVSTFAITTIEPAYTLVAEMG